MVESYLLTSLLDYLPYLGYQLLFKMRRFLIRDLDEVENEIKSEDDDSNDDYNSDCDENKSVEDTPLLLSSIQFIPSRIALPNMLCSFSLDCLYFRK